MPNLPKLTVDCVVMDANGQVLLIRRKYPPHKGSYALPGGFLEAGETVEEACRRELREETGMSVGKLRLVGVYSKPGRDPRGPTVSVAYLAKVRKGTAAAGDDAAAAEWVSGWRRMPLAFDHAAIIADAIRLARRRVRAARSHKRS